MNENKEYKQMWPASTLKYYAQATMSVNKFQNGLSPNIRHVEAVITPEQIDIFSFCNWKMWMKTRSIYRINLRGLSSISPQTEISTNKVEIRTKF